MTTDQLKNVILEAVDCLHQRKCRPDRESIAVYVMRKLGSSMNEVFNEIENIVDQGALLKVEYKSSISYRSPNHFSRSILLQKHSRQLNSSKTQMAVISAMNELLTNPVYSYEGIPFEELKKKLTEQDKDRFGEESIKLIFEREESAGNIQVAECGIENKDNMGQKSTVRIFPKDIKVPSDMKLISFADDANSPSENTKKKKRSKKETDAEVTDNDQANRASGKVKGVKAKNKNSKEHLVYAVKSDPHKKATSEKELDLNDPIVKTKADLINSISMKVVAGKTNALQKTEKQKGKGKSINSTIAKGGSAQGEDTVINRTPSLTLVNHETLDMNAPFTNGDTEEIRHERSSQTNLTASSSSPSISPKKIKLAKGKKVLPNKSPQKSKKHKLDEEIDELLTVRQKPPPRYTYASKKRAKEDDEMEEDSEYEDTEVASNVELNQCTYCRREENHAVSANNQIYLSCSTCNAKFHPACIDYSEDQAKRLKTSTESEDSKLEWQCFSCKRCGVCQKALMSSDTSESKVKTKDKTSRKAEQRYILCDRCDRGYHVKCIGVSNSPSLNVSSWYCRDCEATRNTNEEASPKKKILLKKTAKKPPIVTRKKGCSSDTLTAEESSYKSTKNGNHSTEVASICDTANSENSDIPDISSWTPSQVQKFFTEKGLPDEAASLREQEIDGMSLLLLRRADVIFGLNLRLGPALKIYRLVCQLQQHSSALKKKGEGAAGGNTSSSSSSKEPKSAL